MNRRGKRLTLGVMGLGLLVVLILVVAHWDTVSDHVEAWHFQLTRETETIDLAGDLVIYDPTLYRSDGLRVLEQRFPRKAYVVMRDEAPRTIDKPALSSEVEADLLEGERRGRR